LAWSTVETWVRILQAIGEEHLQTIVRLGRCVERARRRLRVDSCWLSEAK